MLSITTIDELVVEIGWLEQRMGITSQNTPLRERLNTVLYNADAMVEGRDTGATAQDFGAYIGDVQYLKDLSIAGEVILETEG